MDGSAARGAVATLVQPGRNHKIAHHIKRFVCTGRRTPPRDYIVTTAHLISSLVDIPLCRQHPPPQSTCLDD